MSPREERSTLPRLAQYLGEVIPRLRLDPLRERQIIRELHGHLADRVRELEERGCSRREAIDEATRSFGSPQAVADEMYQVHSTGRWSEAFLAAAPYLTVSFLFAHHLWHSLPWLAVFLTASVIATLIGRSLGKPLWMFPWAGFSLVLPLVSGLIAAVAVGQGGWGLLHGQELALPIWAYIGLLAYVPLSLWMLVSTMSQVIRRDWLLASLMLLPFPILARWLLSLQVEGSALVYNRPSITPEADLAIALVFLSLAAIPVLFVRLNQRRLKIAALLLATPPSFVVAAYNLPGFWGMPWLALFALLAALFLLTPALLDRRMGRGSGGYRASLGRWAEGPLEEV